MEDRKTGDREEEGKEEEGCKTEREREGGKQSERKNHQEINLSGEKRDL